MARASTQTSPSQNTRSSLPTEADPVETVLKDNPEIAEELANLTRGEQIIRLRQRGLIDFDVQE